jgi:hypothetical protein
MGGGELTKSDNSRAGRPIPAERRNGMIEIRKLWGDDLRRLCIDKRWYTCGHNEEYSVLLNKAASAENVTTELIVELAEDIKAHSDTEYDIKGICFEIARNCNVFFEDENEAN